ncbi:hypothetical protein Zmor_025131 [Zophobas morio]|uniref:Uncharacterized protein n=1 Tax=Zophobas morio TaxID=2755281 RepID=A0AA38M3A3_9CUCU|nr:hypothetical protein Zmor_025131 [Zophobas morio]
MSCPPGSSRRKTSQTISFIKSANPDIFSIRPRRGGILPFDDDIVTSTRIEEEDFAQDFESKLDEKISKEFRVQTALDEDDVSIDSEDATLPNPLKDAMYMFGVTISTLMMMASKQPDIPKNYMVWTKQCLECIRDDFGNHPPNVQGILNHIRFLDKSGGDGGAGETGGAKEGGDTTGGETTGGETTDEEDQTIRTTTKVKMGNEDEE